MKLLVGTAVFLALGALAWLFLGMWIKTRWPAQIPEGLGFDHELKSQLKLREVAEKLSARFNADGHEDVACLGPVRGNAARILFHSGPNNTRANHNIHRADYVLYLERRGKDRIRLFLKTNSSYTYYRIALGELAALRQALMSEFGDLDSI